MLQSSGYQAEKITGNSRRFDIIAWNRDAILGLVIRTSKSRGIGGFPTLVGELAEMVQRRLFPGEIQIWILQSHEWNRYQVLPGGAILCTRRLV